MRSPALKATKPGAIPSKPNGKGSNEHEGAPAILALADGDQLARAGGCAGLEREILQQGLAATYWFDPGDRGESYSVSIRFSGRRMAVTGKRQRGDDFERVETVENIHPGGGPTAITTRVQGINPGSWVVRAQPVHRKGQAQIVKSYPEPNHGDADGLMRMLRYWGSPAMSPVSAAPVATRLAPFARAPGTFLGVWPALVGLGVLVGLVLQALLIGRARLDVPAAMGISVLASLVGLVGAKLWYLALHPRDFRGIVTQGLCIQGFVVGVAATLLLALELAHIPIGAFLDAAAPGLFFGMAIGRPGCLFAGCCVGRPSASRWAVWSSDGRLGTRRIPAQLLEALVCLVLGVAALIVLLLRHPTVPGGIFIGAVAAYTLARQILLPLRAEPRKFSWGPPVTMAVATLVLVADILLTVLV